MQESPQDFIEGLAKRWMDPIARIEDIFNIKRADGTLTPFVVPKPQQEMIRDGILGRSKKLVGTGNSYISVTNKGRQLGFSVILAAEAILIAEDYPGTDIYYVATAGDQAADFMKKLNQLIDDSNHWPEDMGGGRILNVQQMTKVYERKINNTSIYGLTANPSSIRGKTGIAVIFDEAAWAIRFKGQASETWKALKYIISQGGSARIQSTPRTSDTEEFFWGMVMNSKNPALNIFGYECPVIENWRELDLEEPLFIGLNNEWRVLHGMGRITEEEKQSLYRKYENRQGFIIDREKEVIQQNAIIHFWWKSIMDLEIDRATDLEQFKQEYLCIPLDETYKLIKSEWLYLSAIDPPEWDNRRKSKNRFYIMVDIAQKHDITAITVVEQVPDDELGFVYYERKIEETQEKYPEQVKLIIELAVMFKPDKILIDNTGHGSVIGDMLEKELMEHGMHKSILKRNTFTAQLKEQMAIGFRNLIMPTEKTGLGRYRCLYKEGNKKYDEVFRHITRVEKEIMNGGMIRYSGKKYGRDDHFWSKAQIAIIDLAQHAPAAYFGKSQILKIDKNKKNISPGKVFLNVQNKLRMFGKETDKEIGEKNKKMIERVRNAKNILSTVKHLETGVMYCQSQNNFVTPINCLWDNNCTSKECPSKQFGERICLEFGVKPNEVWEYWVKNHGRKRSWK